MRLQEALNAALLPPPTTFVESHEHDALRYRLCTNDQSDASAKYYPPRSSLRNKSIFLDTGLVSDEYFDDAYVNPGRRNRDFVFLV